MPRARNIKPGFFANEDLAEIEPTGRLLFIGLWMLADRDGRLEDRPKRIKGEIFPYDNCDVDSLLNALQNYGFILRYEIDGARYIQITNFVKHQNPHPKETSKGFPAPENCKQAKSREIKLQASDKQATSREKVLSSRENQHTCRAESLNPDSLNPELYDSKESYMQSQEDGKQSSRLDYGKIVQMYHDKCPSLQSVSKLTSERKRAIKARFTKDLHGNLDELAAFLDRVEASDFITGRNGAWKGKRGVDWIFKQENFIKIQEGNYDNMETRASPVPFTDEDNERIKAEMERQIAEEWERDAL